MILLHNPRCGKSRAALTYLESLGFEPEVRLYLKNPLTKKEIEDMLSKLKIQPENWIRKKDAAFKGLSLKEQMQDNDWIEILTNYPELIERPVIIFKGNAIIARDTPSLKLFLERNFLLKE